MSEAVSAIVLESRRSILRPRSPLSLRALDGAPLCAPAAMMSLGELPAAFKRGDAPHLKPLISLTQKATKKL